MNGDFSVPPLRDLPAGRLAQRREHLLFEMTRKRESRGVFASLWPSRLVKPRRRRFAALAVAVLVVVVGATSAVAVRALLVKGIVGLAPVGATPSTPKSGELVFAFTFGHTSGDPGRFRVLMYADGRLIQERLGGLTPQDTSTGLLEQRLTLEGVEFVKAEVVSTGLVDDGDLHFHGVPGLTFGKIELRTADRFVHVTWGDIGGQYSDVTREMPTAEQASALIRLDKRLADPASWLPESAWKDPEITPYVPSGYSVCYEGAKGVGLSRVLALLPPAAENLLRTQGIRQGKYTNLVGTFVYWCSDLTNEQARALERTLDVAGVYGYKDVFGLTYGARLKSGVFDSAEFVETDFSLTFNPRLPDEK